MRTSISYGRQSLGLAEYLAVLRVLRSPFLTQGPEVKNFEEELCRTTGAPYAVVVANGTAALDLAVRAAVLQYQIPSGSSAITSPNTFVASSNALLHNQIRPEFCDINANSYNMDLQALESKLLEMKKAGSPSPSLILPVHFAGQAVDMPALQRLAEDYGIGVIIEDAAHAIGSYYSDGHPVGSCHHSKLCCFSFHPVKSITSAEGGAVTTRDPDLYQILLQLRSHGIIRDANRFVLLKENTMAENSTALSKAKDTAPNWYYEMQELGLNLRLSDLHAALGRVQLQKLPHFAAQRRKIAQRYTEALSNCSWMQLPKIAPDSCPHLYAVRIQQQATKHKKSREQIIQKLRSKGIGTQIHYIPVPMQPYYHKLGYRMENLPESTSYYQETLSLPLFPTLRWHQQKQVIASLLH